MFLVNSSKVVIVMCTCWTASSEVKPCSVTAPSNLSGQQHPCSVVHVHFVKRQKPTDQHPLHGPNAVVGDGDQGSTTPVVLDGSSTPLTSHSLTTTFPCRDPVFCLQPTAYCTCIRCDWITLTLWRNVRGCANCAHRSVMEQESFVWKGRGAGSRACASAGDMSVLGVIAVSAGFEWWKGDAIMIWRLEKIESISVFQ